MGIMGPVPARGWNVRSLPAHLPSLQNLLNVLKCSIALLSETWFLPIRSLSIPQFKIYRSDRSGDYGGVAIAIHRSLKSKLILIDNVTRNRFTNLKIDIIGVEVVLSDSSPPLKVWSCYFPSSSNIPVNLWQDLFTIVTQNTLLCGDFNAFHPAWGSDLSSRRGNLIYNTINSLDLCILNDGSPTHIGRPGSSDSAINLSFCSPDISWYLSWRTLSEPHGSDHIPIIVTTKTNRLFHFTKRSVNLDTAVNIHSSFNFNKANWSSFSLQVQNSIASLTDNNPSILSYSTLTSIINNSAESSIPRKRPNSNSNFRRSESMHDFLKYRNSCALTTRLLKSKKRKNWKAFCSNLKPSHTVQHLWSTAKRYKNCISPRKNFENNDWFDNFCSKVAPCHVPSASEIYPNYYSQHSPPHVLTNDFSMTELDIAISSRKSTASGLNNISPIMLKHLPVNAIDCLLSILDNILATQQVPSTWTSYRVIPIPKLNSNNSFRPISLSSSICKVFEFMLKSRLDWWLESNSILPTNLFAFRKGMGTLECLSTFIGKIYHSFNNKEFFVATFVDIRGAFDSVNISTLISHLLSLQVPTLFCNVLSSLFKHRNLFFLLPSVQLTPALPFPVFHRAVASAPFYLTYI
ncbi:hypothetical protein QTP88_017437 [Uroleucon formosanum]